MFPSGSPEQQQSNEMLRIYVRTRKIEEKSGSINASQKGSLEVSNVAKFGLIERFEFWQRVNK
jgi:hypothetical protein